MSKSLRPYQSECHESVISRYNAGIIKQLIILFTGAGKTYLLIKLLERMGFKRVLWLSFQEELVSQSALAFIADKFDEEFYKKVEEIGFLDFMRQDNQEYPANDFTLGCIKADIFKPDANVVMGSVMTISKRLDRLPEDYFDCIICDEAHLFGSKTAYNTIEYFRPKLLIGCTATAHRNDGMMLGDIFDEITFEYGLDRGIKDGYCTQLDAIRIKTNVSLDKVKTIGGDLNQKELSNEVNTLARNQLIVDKWKQYASGRQTIAFCVGIQHSIDLAEQFQMNGINAVAVSSDEELTPDRSKNIKKFKEGKIEVLTNTGILVAGFDHVNVGCAIMASPTKSLTRYLQSIGRAARLKGTDFVKTFGQNAVLMDIVDVTNRHNLINAWELDRKKPLEERCFTTDEKKAQILDARLAKVVKIEHERDVDEEVVLLKLPNKITFNSPKMRMPATENQLRLVKYFGYDIEETRYTNQQCNDIIGMQLCSQQELDYLSKKGYDIDGATKANYSAAYYEHEIKNKNGKTSKTKD